MSKKEDKMKKDKITIDDLLTKIPDKFKIMDNVFRDIMDDEIEVKK